jgi:sec-independent protein translocase protein TatC
MVKRPNEDLFSDSTMTFGEHLEELRTALAKAVVGLVVGFLIGLYLADYVVSWIQEPLRLALEGHYVTQAVERLTDEYRREGREVPPGIKEFIGQQRLIPDTIFVEAGEVTRLQPLVTESPRPPLADDAPPASPPDAQAKAADGGEPAGSQSQDETPAGPAAPSLRVVKAPTHPPDTALLEARIWKPINAVVRSLSAQEAFMIWIKAGFVTGVVIASPYIFWQLWAFVGAGLYPHEKRYVYIYLPFSIVLFLWGASMAFFFAFSYVLDFLFGFNRAMHIDPDPRISEWLGFVVFMPLGFGIAFQLPLVMLFLQRVGIVETKSFVAKWRIAILIIFVTSAILTPSPDPVSMLMMALPLTLLYFLGISLCRWMPRNRNQYAEAYEP